MNTVEANLARIYRKLGSKTRAELDRLIRDLRPLWVVATRQNATKTPEGPNTIAV